MMQIVDSLFTDLERWRVVYDVTNEGNGTQLLYYEGTVE